MQEAYVAKILIQTGFRYGKLNLKVSLNISDLHNGFRNFIAQLIN